MRRRGHSSSGETNRRRVVDLTEAQWRRLAPLLPKPRVRKDRRGRPWHDLPDRYPPYQTCHRRFQFWARSGTLARVLHQLARELAAAGGYDFTETFIDATFAGAKKGASPSASPGKGKAPRSW